MRCRGLIRLSAFLVTLAIFQTGALSEAEETTRPNAVELFLGEGYSTVANANRVDAFEIVDPPSTHQKSKATPLGRAEVAGYPVGRGIRLPTKLAENMRQAVLAPQTYKLAFPSDSVIPLGRLCGGFEPGVALRFEATKSKVPFEMLFCFKCGEAGVQQKESPTRRSKGPIVRRMGPVAIVDLSPEGEEALLRLMVKAFPKNKALARVLGKRTGR